MTTRTRVVRFYYGTLALLLGYTVAAQTLLTHHEHRSLANTFNYFTIQSNVLILVTSIVLFLWPQASGARWRVARLGALSGITVTGVVYATVLDPYVHLSGDGLIYNYIFHCVVPFAAVAGFIFVGPRVAFRRGDLAFIAWPILWLAYTMLRGAVARPEVTGFGQPPSHYPYRFLDIDRVSIAVVIGSVIAVAVLLIGVALAYIWAGKHLWVPKTSSVLIKPRLGLTVAPGMIFGHVLAPRVLDHHARVLVAAPVTSR